MRYLDAAEYTRFGLEETTGDDLVTAASAMIDAFCQRPSLGLTQYVERMRVRGSAATVRLSNGPVVLPLVAVRVRMGSAGAATLMADVAQAFSLGGAWSTVDAATVDVGANGEVTIAANLLGMPFADAEITYTAGYAEVPTAVKVACAQVVRNAQGTPALNVKTQSVDGMRMEYFAAALMDAEVRRMLQPYRSQRVG